MIYLDHAAATPLDPQAKKAMVPFFAESFGNPSSPHEAGKIAREAITASRKTIAGMLGCKSDEVIFTGSGTESNNLAILGVARFCKSQIADGKWQKNNFHIITSAIEHESVLEPIRALEEEGYSVTYLPVDKYGLVDPKNVRKSLRPETILVSIMHANNEIGTIEPIREISREIRKWKIENRSKSDSKFQILDSRFPVFHTDACQTAGYLNISVEYLGVDLLTLNGSKLYGPKGVGGLYKKHGVELQPLLYGGGQESGLRSGTENVPGIVGLTRALERTHRDQDKEAKRQGALRDLLGKGILESIPGTILHGPPLALQKKIPARLPNNLNISFPGIDAELIIFHLEKHGIYVSSGSACASERGERSHVLKALGVRDALAASTIRMTLGRGTTRAQIIKVLTILPRILASLE